MPPFSVRTPVMGPGDRLPKQKSLLEILRVND
jgi:hypothetical protein